MKKVALLTALLLIAMVAHVPQVGASSGTVKVIYGGGWSGAILDDDGSRSVDGSGTRTFSVRGGIISVTFQKMDDSSSRLTVQIIDGSGKVVAQQSTTAAYGVVSVAEDISTFGGLDWTYICIAGAVIGGVVLLALYSIVTKREATQEVQRRTESVRPRTGICTECFSDVPIGSKHCPGCGRVIIER